MERGYDEYKKIIDDHLLDFIPNIDNKSISLYESMKYSLTAGGKRLRPVLLLAACDFAGGDIREALPYACAVEYIHTYSLIHDDLPAMDNDEFRRGRKTTWTVYGDGMAVLAGDGLLNLAFETAAGAFSYAKDFETSGKIARAIQILGAKSGVRGMIGGQTADIEAEDGKNPLTEELLLFIHENKTAALIQAAFMIGAVLAGADEQAVTQMKKAAYNIGIAFQIQDDILDVTSTTEILGKPVGSDEKNHKLTYVTLKGLTESKKEVARLSEEAIAILSSFENKNEFLLQLVTSLINREK